MPRGSKRCFRRRCSRASARGSADGSARGRRRRASTGPCRRRRAAAARTAVAVRTIRVPAQRTAPVDERLAAADASGAAAPGSDSRHSCRAANSGSTAVAQPLPPLARRLRPHALAAELAPARAHRRGAARQPHPRAARRTRRRPTAAAAAPAQRLKDATAAAAASSRRSVSSGARQRQHLERDLRDDAEDAERAAQQPRDIKPGDVLHHLAAEAQQLALRRSAAAPRARSRAPRRRTCAAAPTARRRSRRRSSGRRRRPAARRRGTGRAAASAASISDRGVPQRAVMTSSAGS